jgi:hypothetical protein
MRNLSSIPSVWMILGPVLGLGIVSFLLLLFGKGHPAPPEKGWNGIFYSNPDDPALFAPKRFGIGYTLNFGNPWSWAVLVVIFVIVTLPILISAAYLHHLPT